jgi:hypothetical protein
MLLNRPERFTQANPEPGRNFAQDIEYVFFPGRLRLFLGKHLSIAAGFRAQSHDVLAS